MNSTMKCIDCLYGISAPNYPDTKRLSCHRYPPVVVATGYKEDFAGQSYWPKTLPSYFCGEFKARETGDE